jgi:uncharacterized DUF497 family protein
MDIEFRHGGTLFVWHYAKASENEHRHGVEFFEAVTVFHDPLFVLTDASVEAEARQKAIGFSSDGHLLAVVHVEVDSEYLRIISAWRASAAEEAIYDQ